MSYSIELGRMAEKSIKRGLIDDDELYDIIDDFLDSFEGADVNIHFKKLAGKFFALLSYKERKSKDNCERGF